MLSRRELIVFAGATGLAGCSGQMPKIPVSVTLPPEVQTVVDDATAIIRKVESLGNISAVVTGLIDKAKGFVASLTSGVADHAGIVSQLVNVVTGIAEKIAPSHGVIATAIETLLPLIGSVAGLRMAARRPTGMSPAQARAVLQS
jgi:hypothetical protein